MFEYNLFINYIDSNIIFLNDEHSSGNIEREWKQHTCMADSDF